MIEALPLPEVQPGELIAIPVSGAYHLSMGSNYNGARRPAVLWLEHGLASLIQTRETPEDLLRRDRWLGEIESEGSSHQSEMAAKSETAQDDRRFTKYQALGNDYLVLRPIDFPKGLTAADARLICHRNYGIGADGILFGPLEAPTSDFGVRIYNADGSEAETSGNGLRIFSRYLWEAGLVRENQFSLSTLGGTVTASVQQNGKQVTVEMGHVSFDSTKIPVSGPPREVIDEVILVGDQEFRFSAATIGNPHCVILLDELSAQFAQRWGPEIEKDPRFTQRTNVQFMKILDHSNIQIEIWERGVGYTLASGSSSCAAAAVAYRLGRCGARVTVHMPGGAIDITISEGFAITMTGAVSKVSEGILARELLNV